MGSRPRCFLSCLAYGKNGARTVIRLADARLSVDHDQLLHQPFVDGGTVRLQDENVTTANRFGVNRTEISPFGKVVNVRGEQLSPQIFRDLLSELSVRAPTDQDELLFARRRNFIHLPVPLQMRPRLPALQNVPGRLLTTQP